MGMAKSLRLFIAGIIKRIYWLIPALFLDPIDLLERIFGEAMNTPSWIGWLLIGLAMFIATFLTYHDLRIQSIAIEQQCKLLKKAQSATLQRKDKLSDSDKRALADVRAQMDSVHGHSDRYGLESDMQTGYPASNLMDRNCTKCGKPRNQRGDWMPYE